MTSLLRSAAILLLLLVVVPARAVEVERVVSPGGIEAWLVRDEKNPIVSMQWLFAGGSALDPKGKLGLAEMAASLLTEGAGDLDSQAFQKRLEDNSISLGFSAGSDYLSGGLQTLVETQDLAFDLARLAMTRPRFDVDAVERVRGQTVAAIRRGLANPNFVLQRAAGQVLWGDHPYGQPVWGTLETVPNIAAEDLKAFPARRLTRDRLLVAVSGNISPKTLGKALDTVFGGLPAKGEPFAVPDTAPGSPGEIVLVPRPIPQTIMMMAHKGIPRSDPDWYAATVLNYVLGGGGFSSRLMEEVREKRGLTYGISTGISSLEHASVMTVGGSMANANAGKAIDLIRQIWADLARNGITETELQNAKTYLTGSFPLSFTNNGAIADVLLSVRRDNLGIDFLDRRNALIEAVTIEDVKRVAARLLDPAQLATILVGQPEGITPTRTLDIGGS